mmetsp:Transcript_33092/g.55691  ORF Transcript_33092/g.55691 Transcript_33092/m.55691 type:complete len:149 (+) Transcript_33092:228-674(+)
MASWGTQYSKGDQGNKRVAFWRSGFKICPDCKSEEIKSTSDSAGCRHNGDAYGTELFQCRKCEWNTSFQWDEAGDSYYYETRGWERNETTQSKPIARPLDEELIQKYKRVLEVVGESGCRANMREEGIDHKDIFEFFDNIHKEQRSDH